MLSVWTLFNKEFPRPPEPDAMTVSCLIDAALRLKDANKVPARLPACLRAGVPEHTCLPACACVRVRAGVRARACRHACLCMCVVW